MSYGIWKRRGKDWSSFELDGCDDWKWRRMPEARRNSLMRRASDHGLFRAINHDPAFVVWYVGQRDKGWSVSIVQTGSDHALWIAYRGEASKNAGLRVLGYDPASVGLHLMSRGEQNGECVR